MCYGLLCLEFTHVVFASHSGNKVSLLVHATAKAFWHLCHKEMYSNTLMCVGYFQNLADHQPSWHEEPTGMAFPN